MFHVGKNYLNKAIIIINMLRKTLFCAMYSIFTVFTYWLQMQSTFFIQGERMDLSVGSAQIPVAMLNAFNTVALILLIPVLDRVIYPCFQRIGRPLRHLHRIGVCIFLVFVLCTNLALTLNILNNTIPHQLCRCEVKDVHGLQSFVYTHDEESHSMLFTLCLQ